MTQPVREARSPGSCVHLHPKLIYKVVFPGRTAPVTCGAAKVTGSPFAGPAHWWLRPPSTRRRQLLQLRATVASPRIPRARHITLPSLSFPSFPSAPPRYRGRPGTVGCLGFPRIVVQPRATSAPPRQCWEHQGPSQHGPAGALRLPASYFPGSRALARGRSCLCRTNGINQNKRQRACF